MASNRKSTAGVCLPIACGGCFAAIRTAKQLHSFRVIAKHRCVVPFCSRRCYEVWPDGPAATSYWMSRWHIANGTVMLQDLEGVT